MALLEPFIDTIVICTMTGLVIILTGVWDDRVPTEIVMGGSDLSYVQVDEDGHHHSADTPVEIRIEDGRPADTGVEGARIAWHDVAIEQFYVDPEMTRPFTGVIDIEGRLATTVDGESFGSLWAHAVESGAPLTQEGFRRGLSPLGDWGHYIIVLAVLLFAISTAISWSYYGDRCANYLFGSAAVLPYKVAFVAMHYVGAVLPLAVIWNLGDVFLAVVIVPNLIALILLSGQVVDMTRSYFEREPWRENEAKHAALKRAGKL